jgi:mannan endo-1,4-beta-mannosidase
MNGNWFWWSKRNGREFVEIWQDMHNYFNSKGLDNLLWVYAPDDSASYDHTYYPGSSYVDIIGIDHYGGSLLKQYDVLDNLITDKPFGITEYGDLSSDPCAIYNVTHFDLFWIINNRIKYNRIVFFQVWHLPWAIIANPQAKGLLNNPIIITRDELPNFDVELPDPPHNLKIVN